MPFQERNVSEIGLVALAAGPDLAEITHEVKTGVSEFFSIGALNIVTRSEITTRGKELVIVCTQGTQIKQPLKILIERIKAVGFEFIRFHPTTKKRGLATMRIAQINEPFKWVEESETAYFVIDLRAQHGQ